MAFEATKKEWCELYSFFRLLADGKVVLGTAEGGRYILACCNDSTGRT